MNAKQFINDTEYYAAFEGHPDNMDFSLELYLPEMREYSIRIWQGYLTDLFACSVSSVMPWTGFTRDYHGETGTYGKLHRTIDVDEYLSDLLPYKGRPFLMARTAECLDLMCSFLEFAKQEGKTVHVSWAEDFSELEEITDFTLGADFWHQFDFSGGRIICQKPEICEEILLVEYPDDITLKAGYHEYLLYTEVYWKHQWNQPLDRNECYKKAAFRSVVTAGLSYVQWELTKTEHKPSRNIVFSVHRIAENRHSGEHNR